jgi:Asp/Glu/hydantoin racemase
MTYGLMSGCRQPEIDLRVPRGQVTAGNTIGILVLELSYPYLPGSVANSSTFSFPVVYECLEGASREVLSGDPTLLNAMIEGARRLQRHGVRAIVGACGYFAHYQQRLAAALDVPVFLSSLLQVPVISRALKPSQRVGVICADANFLSRDVLAACGIGDPSSVVIAGAQDCPEFKNILFSSGHLNSAKLERELIDLATRLVHDNAQIGAILLECSDMPPYAWSIQNAIRLPVFDFTTMINWVHNAVLRYPFSGFI